jgi:two-component system, chemotaxis family, protein-glutamate methylesterase/glutaminase
MNPARKIKVLVVDDSAVVRKMITESLSHDPQIEVVGTAPDPYVGREKILELNPDVLTLDIEMPRMDGITFLKILQQHRPMPVIVISSLTQSGSAAALAALEAGAVDVLAKPSSAYSIGALGEQLAMRVKAAAMARLRRGNADVRPSPSPARRSPTACHPRQIILIGASTGGVEALTRVLCELPDGLPGIAIVQHIPPYFSRVFAERINSQAALEVREAAEGDLLRPGLALIAPGDFHMTAQWTGSGYRMLLNQKPAVHHCRPAVDVLFRSVAEIPDARVVAAILTGMGSDGALGLQALKAHGAHTLAQDESTSVVYGMPRAAAELGVVDQVLPLPQIASALCDAAHTMNHPHRQPVRDHA